MSLLSRNAPINNESPVVLDYARAEPDLRSRPLHCELPVGQQLIKQGGDQTYPGLGVKYVDLASKADPTVIIAKSGIDRPSKIYNAVGEIIIKRRLLAAESTSIDYPEQIDGRILYGDVPWDINDPPLMARLVADELQRLDIDLVCKADNEYLLLPSSY